ncbi:transient receptor potential cation channel subfamily M member 7-like isoform X1 [Lampetra planeri]
MSQKSWIEQNFSRRECCYIIPSSKDPHRCLPGCQICQQLIRCCCGRLVGQHEGPAPGLSPASSRAGLTMGVGESGADPQGSWNVERHTRCSPTDAYGIIEFQGGAHTYRSKYARVSYDSRPDLLLQLMVKEWQMELPRLLISVHGGLQNFELHPKLKQVFSKGLIKAALTTGAWIFTGGVNTGVVNHVGNALKEHASRSSHKICTIGIAPWGVIENRGDLVGQDVVSPYQTLSNPLSKLNLLNSLHSHFILVDDGTVGKYGAEAQLRRELEKHIGLQKIHTRMGQGVPVVGLVAEGGPNVIVTVLEYLLEEPPVPVVVCEGTGRAADILAFLHKNTDDTGELCDGLHDEIVGTIKKTFNFSHGQATHLLQTLLECMRRKELITVFHTGSEDHSDVDLAILTALLKGTNFSSADQLNLALAWDRVDIAKNHVFVYGQHWMVGALEKAMLDALVMDRVDFVKLLIENGVSMHKFLTITRLEELYNTKNGPINPTLYYLVRDVKKSHLPPDYKITLIDVGLVIEFLMGGAFRSMYTRKRFRLLYQNLYGQHRKFKTSTSSAMLQTNTSQIFNHRHQLFNPSLSEQESQTRHNHFLKTAQPYKRKASVDNTRQRKQKMSTASGVGVTLDGSDPECSCFAYPFNELLAWAVLMKRQRMAMFFWQHGEESLAKALVACKLYRSLAGEAKQSEAVEDSSEELKQYSTEFGQLALDLLDQSFRQDERMAMKLLTYELRNWSNFTCLKLAVSSRHRPFVAHTCTQMLLADMWMGRLNMRKNSWFKVILSILMPPSILMLEYKSKAEMSHIPQSEELHQMGQEEREHRAAATRDIPMEVFSNGSAADGGESGHKEEEGIWIRPSGLSLSRRIYEFYHAPIVKFWFNTLAYIGFLMLFTYVVLVKLQQLPSVQEWFVILYLFMSAIERVREIFMSEPGKFGQKIKVWLDGYWNINDSLGILLFFVAVALRSQSHLLIEAKIVYSLDVIFWYVRLLDVFAVNQNVGPYIMMIGKMMANMFSIVIIMAIVLLSFGVARQAILFKEADPSWYLARNIVFQPYWMIFGEVYAPEIDACENIMKNSTDDEYPPCTAGAFITPFLQAVYLFVQYIIMVNLLIAFFNNIYLEAKNISDKLWKFHRYHFTMYYHQKPILPPPLILLSYLSLFASQLCRRCKRNPAKRKDKQSWLKLYLTEEDEKKLHEFEEHCVDLYFHGKQDTLHCSSEERIRVTSERVEGMSLQLREVSERVYCIKQSLHSLDTQLGHLQDLSALTVDTLRVLSALDRDTDPAIARQAPHSIGAHSNRQVTPPGHPASARADSRPHFHSSSPPAFWYSGVQGRRSVRGSDFAPGGSKGPAAGETAAEWVRTGARRKDSVGRREELRDIRMELGIESGDGGSGRASLADQDFFQRFSSLRRRGPARFGWQRSLSHEKDTPSGTLACNALPLILTPRQLSPFSSLPSSQPAYPSSLTASKHRQLSLPLPSVSQQAQPGGGLASPRSNVSSMPSFMSSSTAPLMREQQPSATNSVPQQGKATSKSNRSERWKFSSFFGRRTQGKFLPWDNSPGSLGSVQIHRSEDSEDPPGGYVNRAFSRPEGDEVCGCGRSKAPWPVITAGPAVNVYKTEGLLVEVKNRLTLAASQGSQASDESPRERTGAGAVPGGGLQRPERLRSPTEQGEAVKMHTLALPVEHGAGMNNEHSRSRKAKGPAADSRRVSLQRQARFEECVDVTDAKPAEAQEATGGDETGPGLENPTAAASGAGTERQAGAAPPPASATPSSLSPDLMGTHSGPFTFLRENSRVPLLQEWQDDSEAATRPQAEGPVTGLSASKAAICESLQSGMQSVSRELSRPRKLEGIVSPYKSSLDSSYSAMERNNLMRLAQTIPFAPIQHRGDLVTVYRLEESSPGNMSNSMSSWSQRGSSSRLEFLSTEEMGGGLRKAMKVLCTWAEEGGILRQGQIYILKSFLPDVVKTWQAVYREDTILHLCLREIQQQRAAQKLLFTFNMMKPKSIPYSPRFLEVFLLYCHAAGQWFAIEEFVNGEFRKFNNNTGEEGQAANLLEESLLAFSHWTYEYTRGELLVLDLQGVGEILTDPSVIKAGEKRSHDMVFGPANLGEDAIKNFRVKHPCNSCCRKLKLPDLKRNEYTPSNIGVSQAASSDA